MIRGIRGATTVSEDREVDVVEATEELLRELIRENQLLADQVASIFISVTDDLSSAFPAKAIREIDGWTYVPVMCMREIPVIQSLPKCIRIMVHYNTTIPQNQIHHIYLREAKALRPDLSK
ncbi:chorismate mutase [Cytobacillus spongiae]|jgi:chorismate mutase|uniref:chorismate mutase n=1 Tax=Cytobacillus spongiae TaxID=2901381 RepID=UPI001F1FCFC7|nr:chorismate mutase [Cytobacillus spongiae]UII54634.1 chorismate mutase [Cytobacillus spongiae]